MKDNVCLTRCDCLSSVPYATIHTILRVLTVSLGHRFLNSLRTECDRSRSFKRASSCAKILQSEMKRRSRFSHAKRRYRFRMPNGATGFACLTALQASHAKRATFPIAHSNIYNGINRRSHALISPTTTIYTWKHAKSLAINAKQVLHDLPHKLQIQTTAAHERRSLCHCIRGSPSLAYTPKHSILVIVPLVTFVRWFDTNYLHEPSITSATHRLGLRTFSNFKFPLTLVCEISRQSRSLTVAYEKSQPNTEYQIPYIRHL
ncbi:LANO_0A02982g1_1 [Lachancea nothofagi CBS 11611]|uniref:LANO_0A02982g1_1 n=1 Tax=Lachancea nothofagi CBS 11611 TaxID=1266666 RepID=A0A1G4INY6_9SACH|nr:LANO_0A02982g1_1 [Lachancea nothofagi CBS 11611]